MTKKRHKSIIKATKGYRMMNSRVFSRAKNAWMKAWVNAYIGRKLKKRDFRRLWTSRINNAVRLEDTNYSSFIHMLYTNKVKLNRKVLSNMAIQHPAIFKNIVQNVKG